MSSRNEFGDKSMNFRRIRRFAVEWLIGTESTPEFPWEENLDDTVAPELGQLAFEPGLLWGDGVKKTLRFNWADYALGTGIPAGADGEPSLFYVARHKFYGVDTDGDPVAIDHQFNTWPLVQCIERGGGTGGAPWLMFDVLAAGGSIEWALTLDTVTIDFNGAFEGVVVIVG